MALFVLTQLGGLPYISWPDTHSIRDDPAWHQVTHVIPPFSVPVQPG